MQHIRLILLFACAVLAGGGSVLPRNSFPGEPVRDFVREGGRVAAYWCAEIWSARSEDPAPDLPGAELSRNGIEILNTAYVPGRQGLRRIGSFWRAMLEQTAGDVKLGLDGFDDHRDHYLRLKAELDTAVRRLAAAQGAEPAAPERVAEAKAELARILTALGEAGRDAASAYDDYLAFEAQHQAARRVAAAIEACLKDQRAFLSQGKNPASEPPAPPEPERPPVPRQSVANAALSGRFRIACEFPFKSNPEERKRVYETGLADIQIIDGKLSLYLTAGENSERLVFHGPAAQVDARGAAAGPFNDELSEPQWFYSRFQAAVATVDGAVRVTGTMCFAPKPETLDLARSYSGDTLGYCAGFFVAPAGAPDPDFIEAGKPCGF